MIFFPLKNDGCAWIVKEFSGHDSLTPPVPGFFYGTGITEVFCDGRGRPVREGRYPAFSSCETGWFCGYRALEPPRAG